MDAVVASMDCVERGWGVGTESWHTLTQKMIVMNYLVHGNWLNISDHKFGTSLWRGRGQRQSIKINGKSKQENSVCMWVEQKNEKAMAPTSPLLKTNFSPLPKKAEINYKVIFGFASKQSIFFKSKQTKTSYEGRKWWWGVVSSIFHRLPFA